MEIKDQSHNLFQKKDQEPCGFINKFNNCYLNSVLQCLCRIESFKHFCIAINFKSCEVFGKLKNILCELETSDSPLNPDSIKKLLATKKTLFSTDHQQDAQEALVELMQCLNEELINSNMFIGKKQTFLDQKFFLKSSIKFNCQQCGNEKSLPEEIEFGLGLQILNQYHVHTMEELIKLNLDNFELMNIYCTSCKNVTSCNQKKIYIKLPDVLVVHIQRFYYEPVMQTTSKVFTGVKCPLYLSFKKLSPLHSNKTYELVSFIVHYGSTANSGHYVSYCKISNKWFEFNDATVTPKVEHQLPVNEAYLLIYDTVKKNNTRTQNVVMPRNEKQQQTKINVHIEKSHNIQRMFKSTNANLLSKNADANVEKNVKNGTKATNAKIVNKQSNEEILTNRYLGKCLILRPLTEKRKLTGKNTVSGKTTNDCLFENTKRRRIGHPIVNFNKENNIVTFESKIENYNMDVHERIILDLNEPVKQKDTIAQLEETEIISDHHQQPCSDIDIPQVQYLDTIGEQCLSTQSNKSQRKSRKKCCVMNCRYTESRTMFKFPKIHPDQPTTVERCKVWIKNCGNTTLLNLSVDESSFKNLFVCQNHFRTDMFCSDTKTRLKPTAFPVITDCDPISDEIMNQHLWSSSGTGIQNPNENTSENIEGQNQCIVEMENKMHTLQWKVCRVCKENKMTFGNNRCSANCKYLTAENNLDPGPVPPELQGLTFVEEQLIALNHPCVSFFKLKKLQYGYNGNVITFPQNVRGFAKTLPHRIADLTHIITIEYKKLSNSSSDSIYFKVRSRIVYNALKWLKEHNYLYRDIEISSENLMLLPQDGCVYDDLIHIQGNTESEVVNDIVSEMPSDNHVNTNAKNNLEDHGYVHFSGLTNNANVQCNDQVTSKIFEWPTIENTPINEFNTVGYIAGAFPCLYPTGDADLRASRTKKISSTVYFKHLLHYYDGRFAKHVTFRFFALNSIMRWNALTDGSVFIDRNSDLSNYTVVQFKELITQNPSILNKILYRGKNLKGSRPYWHERRNELIDMIEQLGLPTLYFTLSCADLHWPDLFRLLCDDKDPNLLTETERRNLLQQNPLIVNTFFSLRVETFLEQIMTKHFDMVDYWYRFEWQHRGSPHIHGIVWLKNAPNIENFKDCTATDKITILKYLDNLVSAKNPNRNVEVIGLHPCRNLYQHVSDSTRDLSELLVKVQRHKCSSSCIRKKSNSNEKYCRFHFPFELQNSCTLEMDNKNELQFLPTRNDAYLNKFNNIILQSWRANIDISPVTSKKSLIRYLSKYITKSENKSESLLSLVQNLLNQSEDNSNIKKPLGQIYIKLCSERDYSAPEVCHMLSGTKLYSAGHRNFVIVNLNSTDTWVPICRDTKRRTLTTIQRYQNRKHELENVSLWNFCKDYDIYRLNKKRIGNIVRVFPKLTYDSTKIDNESYFRQQVLLHVCWRHERDFHVEGTSWEDMYNHFNIEQTIVNRCDLTNSNDNESESDSEPEIENDRDNDLDEAMVVARLGSNQNLPANLLGLRTIDEQYDWSKGRLLYQSYCSLFDMKTYIRDQKELNANEIAPLCFNNFDFSTFSPEQKSVIDLVQKQICELKSNTNKNCETCPKRIIVQGKAGTGKSFLIKFISYSFWKEFGKESLLLLGPTGLAALNINGETIHSALHISIRSQTFEQLKGESAKLFCNKMRPVQVVIIDEYSMVGCNLLHMIDLRCKQGKGNSEYFGNLIIYMLGDLRQLPPVQDPPLYENIDTLHDLSTINGRGLIDSFEIAFELKKCFRQENEQFRQILDNISVGILTNSDYALLKSRFINNVKNSSSFDNEFHLFSTTLNVNAFNEWSIDNLVDENKEQKPVAKIMAQNDNPDAIFEPANKAGGLEPILYLAHNCKVMLKANLWTAKGLVNGAIGEVIDILYNDGEKPPHKQPVVILCKFPLYTGPGIGPEQDIVPIPPISYTWKKDNETFTRIQFPLSLCYAVTIHKSQGITLEKGVVDIGRREFSLGISYVGLSRVKTLQGLLIEPFQQQRITKLRSSIRFETREKFLAKFLQEKLNKSKP